MRYRLADICFEVQCPPGVALADLCRRYAGFESNGTPDIVVEVRTETLFRNAHVPTRPYPGIDARWEGGAYAFDREDLSFRLVPSVPVRATGILRDAPAALDSILRAALSVLLPKRRGLLLHASGVGAGGRAFVFCGPSGAGKSTVASLTDAPFLLSDDLVAVALRPDRGAVAHSLPFQGLGVARTKRAALPLEVVCMLEKGPAHVLEPMPAANALGRLLRCVVHLPLGDPFASEVLAIAADLVSGVPVRSLRFRRDGAFWPGLLWLGGGDLGGPAYLDRLGSSV